MKDIIVKFENDIIIELNGENASLFEKIEDFALRNNQIMTVCFEKGRKVIKSADYAGLLRLNDGTQIEIYPRLSDNPTTAKKLLGRMVSAYLDIPFEKNTADTLDSENASFMEYFTAVFIREFTKIMKSGMLSGYTSIEENTNSMQGSILFSENIRRNLAHRERLYVRHDVFTPDRAENRLIKTAAAVLAKLTQEHRNGQELKKLMIYLDEVKLSDSCERDFAACVNTRNAKKYTAVLNICRMLLAKKSSGFSGKYASCAIFFPMQELFAAYMAKVAKAECKNTVVKTMAKAGFVCGENRLFPIMPHIAVHEKSGDICCIADVKWSHISSVNEINSDDIFRLLAAAEKLNCDKAVMVYPSYAQIPDAELTMDCGKKISLTIKFADFSEGTITGEFSCEAAEEEEFTEEYSEETDLTDTAEYTEEEVWEDEKIPEESAEIETAAIAKAPEKKRIKIVKRKR